MSESAWHEHIVALKGARRMEILERSFTVDGEVCAATLTLPDRRGGRAVPAVFTAPGFAGVKEMLIPAYSSGLAERGIASLTFDYPGFGASSGKVRQQVDPALQMRAFRAALDMLTAEPAVDAGRIGVWGTSMSGGHALMMAATDPRIRAAATVIPFIHLAPTSNTSLAPVVLRNVVRRLTGRPGLRIPVAGRPGETAAMNSDGAFEWVTEMAAGAPTYRNEVTVASLVKMLRWSTKAAVRQLTVPTLAILAEADTITPPDRVRKALAHAPRVEYISYPQSHFELFTEYGDRVRSDLVEWLVQHLGDGG
jgi:dienelactone hydrolase